MELESNGLKALYRNRFDKESEQRQETWDVLCRDFFQTWVAEDAVVLDLAAGHCEFINNIRAGRRIAVDLNPDVKVRAAAGVETHVLRSDDLADIAEQSDRRGVHLELLRARQPRGHPGDPGRGAPGAAAGGRLLVLQPNVRYCARDYWQFFDHITPVDDRALVEAFTATGFDVVKNIPRFLPYTTKSFLPSWPVLIKAYLRIPLAWRVLGAQAFMVATPTAGPA